MGTSQVSIPPELMALYLELEIHLKTKTRFSLSPRLEKFISRYIETIKNGYEKTKDSDKIYYRARINGVDGRSFSVNDMGAPPEGKSSAGRINPEGISYLYVADSVDTAIAEVRPWKGATITIAEGKLKQKANVISIAASRKGSLTDGIPPQQDNFLSEVAKRIVATPLTELYFSRPTHNEDKLSYLPSQYIAEKFKILGFDGIEYSSVLHENGINIAFFDPSIIEFNKTFECKVTSVQYQHTKS